MNNETKLLKLITDIYKLRICCLSSSLPRCKTENVSTAVAKYPPIKDVPNNYGERKMEKKLNWHEQIRKLPTVEQKLIELNMPKYYGYYTSIIKDGTLGINCLDFLKFITRTRVYKNLPIHYYKDELSTVNEAVRLVKDPVEKLITLHFGYGVNRGYKIQKASKLVKNSVSQQNFLVGLHNIFEKHLGDYKSHLSVDSVDFDPTLKAFWFVGGFEPRENWKRKLKGREHTKEFADNPNDCTFQSISQPVLALRSNLGLPDVVPFDGQIIDKEIEVPDADTVGDKASSTEEVIPKDLNDYSSKSFNPLPFSVYDTDPEYYDFIIKRNKPVTIVPGFWPGVRDEHGHIFYHSRAHLQIRLETIPEEYQEKYVPIFLEQHTINSAFTQALSYSLYQGFTPVDEMTYPIVQQSVSSDGRHFQFSLYQLNTSCLHSNFSTDSNTKINYLWLSEDMPLFESVEGNSVKGFNEEVLRLLCLMYLKKGKERENPNPYLADYKYIMHHDAPEEYKEEFQNFLRHVLSERPKHKQKQEILPWEYIYKYRFKTRHQDPKLKFFEKSIRKNPASRRLDDYVPAHIPRVRRIDFRISRKPKIHSELLFKHIYKTLKNRTKTFENDPLAFGSMNIDKETPPYFRGLLWRRGFNKFQRTLIKDPKK